MSSKLSRVLYNALSRRLGFQFPIESTVATQQTLWPGLAQWHHQPLWNFNSARGVKKKANEVRSGNLIELEGRLYQVTKHQHTHGHGRQLGNVQLELRDIQSRTKLQERRRPSDLLEVVRLNGRAFQFLYKDEEGLLQLMDPQSFEQIAVSPELFGDAAAFLAPGASLSINYTDDGQPISGELPATVELKVVEADPYARGDSATSSYKQCRLEGGARIGVPPFVQVGDTVVVDTAEGTFVKRGAGS
ncbi:Elongation factor P [Coccomyxa sp. Obi]|nr:Elongation factor P [Coccomyxa sp. Obi]